MWAEGELQMALRIEPPLPQDPPGCSGLGVRAPESSPGSAAGSLYNCRPTIPLGPQFAKPGAVL